MLRHDPLANPRPLIARVYSYVAYRIGDGPDAEDVTQATIERAFRYRETFRGGRGEATPWVIGIARRCIADFLADRLETTGEVPETPAPGELEQDAARRLDLAQAISRLDSRDRDLIALRYGADLTTRAIADVLGIRRNTVDVALHRVLRKLRDELGGDEPAGEPEPAPRFAT